MDTCCSIDPNTLGFGALPMNVERTARAMRRTRQNAAASRFASASGRGYGVPSNGVMRQTVGAPTMDPAIDATLYEAGLGAGSPLDPRNLPMDPVSKAILNTFVKFDPVTRLVFGAIFGKSKPLPPIGTRRNNTIIIGKGKGRIVQEVIASPYTGQKIWWNIATPIPSDGAWQRAHGLLNQVKQADSAGLGGGLSGGFFKKIGKVLKKVVKVAAPIAGGVVGSFIAPGIGTALGTSIGGAVGGAVGGKKKLPQIAGFAQPVNPWASAFDQIGSLFDPGGFSVSRLFQAGGSVASALTPTAPKQAAPTPQPGSSGGGGATGSWGNNGPLLLGGAAVLVALLADSRSRRR